MKPLLGIAVAMATAVVLGTSSPEASPITYAGRTPAVALAPVTVEVELDAWLPPASGFSTSAPSPGGQTAPPGLRQLGLSLLMADPMLGPAVGADLEAVGPASVVAEPATLLLLGTGLLGLAAVRRRLMRRT
jgi:hypothetical protein